ncbi:phospho-sugar mutase [Candidatus Saccharibacteria bacterium]|nr:MAG: phospho-sugar mutase [Candidatus Saccharibacteria bacterium]
MDMELLTKHLSEASVANITKWLTEPIYAEYKAEVEKMIQNEQWQQLEDAFFKVIEFGTGGRRGTTGPGSNRINKVTVGESTQALCLYAKQFGPDAPAKGIVIACDTRLSSPELSQYAARVCAGNGFKTYIFEGFRSTPELSFAVRYLGCAAGVVITASHNPPADNGFKAYWDDGAQLVAPHDKGVLELGEGITEIHTADFDEAVAAGTISIIGGEIDKAYVAAAASEAVGTARDISIAYSPLHGAGQTNVLPVLEAAGFVQVKPVAAQMVPDGNFPTIENGKPNPEEKPANDRVVAQLLAEEADIAITNDPDADRFGIMVRQDDEPVYLSGNQSVALAADYVLQKMQTAGTLTPKHFVAKTIVTTDLIAALAEHYGVKTYGNLLIGFKYIGELVRLKETEGETFVMGGEESFGMLKGSYARDKDGASGALMLAEYAAELKASGKTLYDRLLELYKEHGVYLERLDTIVAPGADGFAKMQQIMANLRANPPAAIGATKVTAVLDYQTLERTNLTDNSKSSIDCIKGNVVVLECGDTRRRITVRPSGTEPKLKFYVQWFTEPNGNVDEQYTEVQGHLEGLSRELEGILLEG